MESSVTIKIKGVTKSYLDRHSTENKGKIIKNFGKEWVGLFFSIYYTMMPILIGNADMLIVI